MPASTPPEFRLTGFIGLQPVSAQWRAGYLVADEELMEIADGLVERGERFEVPDGPEVAAGLEDPLAALLTLARCFDRITKATVNFESTDNAQLELRVTSNGAKPVS
jgi:hypothetical protein